MNKKMLIGIAGASGSGKTYLSNLIQTKFSCSIINLDSYYLPQDNTPLEERDNLNFDNPSMIDWTLLKKHIVDIKSGKSIRVPIYSFTTHTRSIGTTKLKSNSILILEGIFALNNNVRRFLDLGVFLDEKESVCLQRRIDRDMAERGRTNKDSILKQYNSTTKPGFINYILPTKKGADMVIQGNDYSNLFNYIEKFLPVAGVYEIPLRVLSH